MTFVRDWTVDPAPCREPDTCSPEHPSCPLCIAAVLLYEAECPYRLPWAELHEWQREAWRREADDLSGGDL